MHIAYQKTCIREPSYVLVSIPTVSFKLSVTLVLGIAAAHEDVRRWIDKDTAASGLEVPSREDLVKWVPNGQLKHSYGVEDARLVVLHTCKLIYCVQAKDGVKCLSPGGWVWASCFGAAYRLP
jgi:hypothetical protein